MKRWKSRVDKAMFICLLLLLTMSSLPWLDRAQLSTGLSVLSSTDSNSRGTSESKSVDINFNSNNKNYSGFADCDTNNTECNISLTEAVANCDKGCLERKYIGTVPISINELENIENSKNLILKHLVQNDFYNKKIVTTEVSLEKKDNIIKKKTKKKLKVDDEEEVEETDFDKVITRACLKDKKNKKREIETEKYTICAMKEMGKLAKLSKIKPTSDEMKDLLDDHVYDQLLSLMKDGLTSEASSEEVDSMKKARRAIESLVEKLAGKKYTDVRKKLAEVKRLAINEKAKDSSRLLAEANTLAAMGDYLGARESLNHYRKSQIEMTQFLNSDLGYMRETYDQMIGVDGFTRGNAIYEYKNQYYQPYSELNQKVWSNNPTFDYDGIGHANRIARSGRISGNSPEYYDQPSRGGPQGNFNGNSFSSGHRRTQPTQGQQAILNADGSIKPLRISPRTSVNNGINGSNADQRYRNQHASPPYNNGSFNYWANNSQPWTQQPSVHGQQPWRSHVSPVSPGLAGSGNIPYNSSLSFYSGYPNYHYSNPASGPHFNGNGYHQPWGTQQFSQMPATLPGSVNLWGAPPPHGSAGVSPVRPRF